MKFLSRFGAALRCASRPRKKKKQKKLGITHNAKISLRTVSDASKYFHVRTRVESILAQEALESFGYYMDVLEAFMCHCEADRCENVTNVIILNLTAYLCREGLDNSFPVEATHSIIPIAAQMLLDEIRSAATSNEFEKIALHAASQVMSNLYRIIPQHSEKIEKNVV